MNKNREVKHRLSKPWSKTYLSREPRTSAIHNKAGTSRGKITLSIRPTQLSRQSIFCNKPSNIICAFTQDIYWSKLNTLFTSINLTS